MESVTTPTSDLAAPAVFAPAGEQHEIHQIPAVSDPNDIAFQLGTWLIGLLSFERTCADAFVHEGNGNGPANDRTREFRISHAALLTCAKLNFRLRKSLTGGVNGSSFLDRSGMTLRDIDDLGLEIRNLVILNESITSASSRSFGEWKSWNSAVEKQLLSSNAANRLRSFVFNDGKRELPASLLALFERPSITFDDKIDISDILPRAGMILRGLEIVGDLLRNDKPLKPSLVVFAGIYEQTRHLIDHINNRLARFPNEEAALFTSLDSASYGAKLELKKVFQQELRGIVQLLPPPSVYARIETAYSLLKDSFQQMLIELARSADPAASPYEFFPSLRLKLDQSLLLREHLWRIFRLVQSAEQTPEKPTVDTLRGELTSFVVSTLRFLHYKDGETLERFSEEVHAARDKKDLVPILHRFGAYLETLFGQICMRAVLADHPFKELN